ncbi:MAG TPA: serine/threonine-protein kinase [Archangium sp.]
MKSAVEVGEVLASDPRSERRRAVLEGVEVELRVVKPGVAVDAQRFLSRVERLAALSHPSLRMVRGGVLLPDGRPAAVLSLVPWTTLVRSGRLQTAALVSLALEVADGLAALHAAGLMLGQVSPADLYPGDPAVLDASLVGLAPADATPQGDVTFLCRVLLASGSGSRDAEPFEAILQRAISEKWDAAGLVKQLTALKAEPLPRRTTTGEIEILEPQLEGYLLSSWQIERVLGEGAMAKVYLATDVRDGRQVAVKVLKQAHVKEPEFVHRFVQEVQAVAAIRNEHIVDVTDFGDEPLPDGRRCVYCVMELLEGVALADAINQGPFGVVRAVRIAEQLARALHSAHGVGIVHRDIKPENVFLTVRDGRDFVKVLDFGIAKLLRPIGNLPKVGTKAGIVVGTPEYMAPEQAIGKPVDARVDVYAVGLVLYELLAGKPPFTAENFGRLVMQITATPPPPLPTVTPAGEALPPELSAVVLKCLEKDPSARFQSAAKLADALTPFDGRTPTPRPSKPLEIDEAALAASIQKSRAPMVALAIGLALLIFALVLMLR